MPDEIRDVKLKQCCVDTLDLIDQKIAQGDSSQSLFDWAPLRFLAKAVRPAVVTVTFQVATAHWGLLEDISRGMDKIKFLAIVKDCRLHQAVHGGEGSLYAFWGTLAQFYQEKADKV
jgi:hypothetical protein